RHRQPRQCAAWCVSSVVCRMNNRCVASLNVITVGQHRGIGAEADALVNTPRAFVGRGEQSNLNALQERRAHGLTCEYGCDTPTTERLERRDARDLGEPIERRREGPGADRLPAQAGEKGPTS